MNNNKWKIKCLLVSSLLASLFAPPRLAMADTHSLQGCLYVETDGYKPIADVTIQVWYQIAGINIPAIGTVITNSSGCFSGTLSGFTVPEDTVITVGVITTGNKMMLTNAISPYSYYNYQFTNSQSVAKGEPADFSDMGINSSHGDTYGVFAKIRNITDGIDLYESKVEAWAGYPVIPVRFPDDSHPAGVSFASPASGIHLKTDEQVSTYYHEWGHWLSYQDASSTSSSSDYCGDYAGSSYPYTTSLYTYNDPDTSSACGHSFNTYEKHPVPGIEGFAEFFQSFLQGKTGDDADEDDADKYDFSTINFFTRNSEEHVRTALLDLVDKRNETQTFMHAYQNAGSKHLMIDAKKTFADDYHKLGMDSNYAYGPIEADPASIYKFPLKYGGTPTLVYGSLSYQPDKVLVDSLGNLCALKFGTGFAPGISDIYCGNTAGTSALTRVSDLPEKTLKANLVNGELLVLSQDSLYRGKKGSKITKALSPIVVPSKVIASKTPPLIKALSPVISASARSTVSWTWSVVTTLPETQDSVFDLAEDPATSTIYIASSYAIHTCPSVGACTPTLLVGSQTEMGYRRGEVASGALDMVKTIYWVNGYLYIADSYGISRYSESAKTLEQYIGTVFPNQYFVNNLHRRTIDVGLDSPILFATNGMQSLYQSDSEDRTYYFDDAEPVTVEYICGTDSATLPASDVVHMFRGQPLSTNFKSAVFNIPGVTTDMAEDIENVNWITLKKQECPAWADGEAVEEITSSKSSSSPSHTVTSLTIPKESELGACLSNDNEQDQTYQSGQEQAGKLENLTPEAITVTDPNKTYPTPVEIGPQ